MVPPAPDGLPLLQPAAAGGDGSRGGRVQASGGEVQTIWHVLTSCSPDDWKLGGRRAQAAGWLARHVMDFGTRQAEYALAALTGGASTLDDLQANSALPLLIKGLHLRPLVLLDALPFAGGSATATSL